MKYVARSRVVQPVEKKSHLSKSREVCKCFIIFFIPQYSRASPCQVPEKS